MVVLAIKLQKFCTLLVAFLVLYRCCCEGNVLLYRRVPALRFCANKSNDLGQKGKRSKQEEKKDE